MGPTGQVAAKGGRISKPAALKAGHDLSLFDCERDEINTWLKEKARHALEADTARVYVVCRGAKKVIAFYALAAGGVARNEAPGALRRNCPDPIPVIILAMLGVDKSEKGQGIGQDLLSDAMRRSIQAAKIIGARALLVHALDAKTAEYYVEHGFRAFDSKAETLFLSMKAIREHL
ncbi:MAG TPA: GNAT family N-acetyltransferase [Hyphomicrobiaceae bacterium]|nr:GNAT family N-acetyltransferase [Hyphomicrobiaceae bacterium]